MLKLRPYRKNDSQKIVTWAQDENTFYKWSEGRLGNFPVSAERLEQAVSGRIDNEKYFPFVAFDEDGIVGFFTLRQPGEVEGELSFGYVILNPKARGKGYGKQMLQLGIKFAFELYGASKVTLEVFGAPFHEATQLLRVNRRTGRQPFYRDSDRCRVGLAEY